MEAIQQYLVSASGQMSVPAAVRHRWHLDNGGPVDVIDLDYGPHNSYHHTAQDTMDKLSVRSLTIAGDVFMETIRLINAR